MIAQELRIGNLVTDEFYDTFKSVIEVESINEKGINLEIEHSNDYPEMQNHWIEPYYPFEKLYPIPLTEEWLIKFGFEKRSAGYWDNATMEIFQYSTGNFYLSINAEYTEGERIEYVHTLQNISHSLYRQELTIKE